MPSVGVYLNQRLTEPRDGRISEFHNMLWNVAQQLEEPELVTGLVFADELVEEVCDLA